MPQLHSIGLQGQSKDPGISAIICIPSHVPCQASAFFQQCSKHSVGSVCDTCEWLCLGLPWALNGLATAYIDTALHALVLRVLQTVFSYACGVQGPPVLQRW